MLEKIIARFRKHRFTFKSHGPIRAMGLHDIAVYECQACGHTVHAPSKGKIVYVDLFGCKGVGR